MMVVITFIFLGLIYACGAALRVGVPGMVFLDLQSTLGWNSSQTALISSFGVAGCMVFLPIAGYLIDKYGWRKIFLLGALLQIIGGVLIAFGYSGLIIYTGALINGGGRTFIYLVILKLLASEFSSSIFSVVIGFFYIFSYGGTSLGGVIYSLSDSSSWRNITHFVNGTVLLSSVVAFLAIKRLKKKDIRENFECKHLPPFYKVLKSPSAIWAIFCTSFGIVVYWTFLSVVAKKYLVSFNSGDMLPLNIMNVIVMIEMVLGGSISYLFNNHRRTFQFLGVLLISLGIIALCMKCVMIGFVFIGLGYGLTAIQICALKDAVKTEYTARAIATANFIANSGIIIFSQLIGFICDKE